jgi:hypothetical protein
LCWRLRGLCCGAARMLTAPGANFSPVEDAVVVGVQFIEMGSGSLCRPLLHALQVLLSRDATSMCGGRRGSGSRGRRTFYSSGLWNGLSNGSRGY